jgi:hypothetical protein
MWCIDCERDVSAVANGRNRGGAVCPRCDSPLRRAVQLDMDAPLGTLPNDVPSKFPPSGFPPEEFAGELPVMPPMQWDDWQLDADGDELQRLLQQFDALADANVRPTPGAAPTDAATGHRSNSQVADVGIFSAASIRSESSSQQTSRGSWLAGGFLAVGLVLFVCGIVLAGWSLVALRRELWLTGVPVTLAGIASLLVGFLLQLEALWRGQRETMLTLRELELRLAELRQATTLLKTSHSGAAQPFYANFADGASPQLMLADLKGQLDLLAAQMSQENRRAA